MVKKLLKKIGRAVSGSGQKSQSEKESRSPRFEQAPRKRRKSKAANGAPEEWRPGQGKKDSQRSKPRKNERRASDSQRDERKEAESRRDDRRKSEPRSDKDRKPEASRDEGKPTESKDGEPRRRSRSRRGGRRRSGQPRAEAEKGEQAAGDAPQRERKSRPPKSDWTSDRFQVPEKEGEVRFHDVGIPDPIMHGIADLGFQYCTPIQAKTLTHASMGQNVAGRAQTGTGKTAAFLITIFSEFLKKPIEGKRRKGAPRALVIAPTRELVIQIVEDAKALGKHCDFNCIAVYGGMDLNKQQKWLEAKPVDLIAATPGRLLDFKNRGVIDLKRVEVLVIDEADRMLDMGFIPDVSRIIRSTPPKAKRRTMLFSATLTDEVLRLASQWMPDPVICEIEPEQVTVDTVEQIVYIVTAREKFRLLYNILKQRPDNGRVLIFGNRRDHTQRLVHNLEDHGIDCELLSGAVQQKKRLSILNSFKSGETKIVVATDVAGRGLHVDDIDLVINYEFPYEPEDYVHRIGRTGRAGTQGTAISFACEEESFVIPAIEEYIGRPLPCTMPEEELLEAPPPPVRKHRPRKPAPSRGGGSRRPRPGGQRRRR